MLLKKTKTRKQKQKTKTRKQKQQKNKKGGFWPFAVNNEVVVQCPNSTVKCETTLTDPQLVKHDIGEYTKNNVWNTCISMNDIYNHIIYITPSNVIIKSVETIQIPEFIVEVSNNNGFRKVMIEDKYISCFLFICNEWYVIMRLLGTTLNTQFFARTEANKAFYKIKNITIDIDTTNNTDTSNSTNQSGMIHIPEGKYTEIINNSVLDTSKWLSRLNPLKSSENKLNENKTNSTAVKLNSDCYENINKQSNLKMFNVLQRFRQKKLFENVVKQNIAKDVVGEVVGEVDDLI